jgi:pilus assembly protein CpaE
LPNPSTGVIDRLLSKCTDHLSLLAAPATLERVYDFGADARLDSTRFAPRCRASCSTLSSMVRVDQARPDRCGRYSDRCRAGSRQPAQHQEHLRPAETIAAQRSGALCCQSGRHPESGPKSTQASSPKPSRPADCGDSIDPQMFGSAANNGEMIAEISANHRTTEMFLQTRNG